MLHATMTSCAKSTLGINVTHDQYENRWEVGKQGKAGGVGRLLFCSLTSVAPCWLAVRTQTEAEVRGKAGQLIPVALGDYHQRI